MLVGRRLVHSVAFPTAKVRACTVPIVCRGSSELTRDARLGAEGGRPEGGAL